MSWKIVTLSVQWFIVRGFEGFGVKLFKLYSFNRWFAIYLRNIKKLGQQQAAKQFDMKNRVVQLVGSIIHTPCGNCLKSISKKCRI